MGKRARTALHATLFAGLVALPLAACGSVPADIEETTERARAERSFRVGVVAGPLDQTRLQLFLAGVSKSAGARPAVSTGATEPLLKQLERGALDVVVGPMSAKSPWATKVHFLPLVSGDPAPPDELQLVAMARNGENAWIALLHRQATTVAER